MCNMCQKYAQTLNGNCGMYKPWTQKHLGERFLGPDLVVKSVHTVGFGLSMQVQMLAGVNKIDAIVGCDCSPQYEQENCAALSIQKGYEAFKIVYRQNENPLLTTIFQIGMINIKFNHLNTVLNPKCVRKNISGSGSIFNFLL